MSNKIIHVTDNSFQKDVLEAPLPVLVDFWAEWCVYCKPIAPMLEELVNTYADKLIITKLDIEANPQIAVKYGIRSIPTLLIFNQGKLVATQVGAISKTELIDFIDKNI